MHQPFGIIQAPNATDVDGFYRYAAVAQSVEHQLPKLRVASSSLVCRSRFKSFRLLLTLYNNLGTIFIPFVDTQLTAIDIYRR